MRARAAKPERACISGGRSAQTRTSSNAENTIRSGVWNPLHFADRAARLAKPTGSLCMANREVSPTDKPHHDGDLEDCVA